MYAFARRWLFLLSWLGIGLLSGCASDGDDAPQPPAGLSYTMTSAVYETGQPIVPNRPSASGSTITRYAVSPVLPAGLVLDTASGVIAGTPSIATPPAVYVVTGENAGGSATARVQIEVRASVAAPAGLTYRETAAIYTVGEAISANAPVSSGGPITAYAIAPALPAGLAFDSQTGAITGTPTSVAADVAYTVTGRNAAGETSATLHIAVEPAPVAPASLAYSASGAAALYVKSEAIVPNTPAVTGGVPTSYVVTPALPPGLSLNALSGVIAGTPTATQSQAVYTITASNRAGSTQAQVRITVTSRGSFSAAGALPVPVALAMATTLADGRVLFAGGILSTNTVVAAAAVYDPATNSWAPTGSMAVPRIDASATRLLDGRVLVVGGTQGGNTETATAEIYDPATGIWSPAASMSESRIWHRAVLLPSGKVLVLGGSVASTFGIRDTVEVYDPVANTWTTMASRLSAPRSQHSATLLADGSAVLLVGGYIPGGGVTAELFAVNDSGTTAVTYPASNSFITDAVLLNDGSVLVTDTIIDMAWRYDPGTSTWRSSKLGQSHAYPTVTVLPDGRVLVAGGNTTSGIALASTELYNPDVNTWTTAASLATGRHSAAATLLRDGSVLVIGGGTSGGGGRVPDAERFVP